MNNKKDNDPDFVALQSLVSITSEMCEYADNAQWEKISAADTKRKELLQNLSIDSKKIADISARHKDLISRLIEKDKQLLKKVRTERLKYLEEGAAFHSKNVAVDGYRSMLSLSKAR